MISAQSLVHLSGDAIVTTSLQISKYFQKRHKDVIKAIVNLDCSQQFHLACFKPSEYLDKRERKQKQFEITKNGFMFLVMGFRGKQAVTWKEKFVTEFNDSLESPSALERTKTVTRKHERQVFELFVAGMQKKDIATSLDLSAAAVSRILHGKYSFGVKAGKPECSQELIDAVAKQHLLYGYGDIDKLSLNESLQPDPTIEQRLEWAAEDEANGDHEAARLNREAAAKMQGGDK